MQITAPFAGSVADIDVTQNQVVGPTDWAILIADTSQWYVETNDLTGLDVVKIKPGQNASVTVDAIPGLTLTGKVAEISDVSGQKGGDITYMVRILLDQSADHPLDSRLRWGMTMESTFGSNVEAQN
jgi:multidrug resistance efflux pump